MFSTFLRETLSRAPFGAKPRLFSRGFLCKTFFIWFLTSNKFVLEIKLAEKESLSLNTMFLSRVYIKGLYQGFISRVFNCSLQEYILNILHTKYIFNFSDYLFNGFYWRFFKGICRETFLNKGLCNELYKGLDKGFMQWVEQGVYAMG
jgi:hypothetical protein